MRTESEVYDGFGAGMAGKSYRAAAYVELGLRTTSFDDQAKRDVYYKERSHTPKYRPNLLAFREIVRRLRALKELCSGYEAQRFNYM